MKSYAKLEESVAHLREELADGHPLTDDERRLLDRTLADVAQMLDDEQDDPDFEGAIYDELRTLAVRIEEKRPNLSIVIGRIVDALAQLGA